MLACIDGLGLLDLVVVVCSGAAMVLFALAVLAVCLRG
jgi:hypothetical protein